MALGISLKGFVGEYFRRECISQMAVVEFDFLKWRSLWGFGVDSRSSGLAYENPHPSKIVKGAAPGVVHSFENYLANCLATDFSSGVRGQFAAPTARS
jgi:hypothetical protein